MSLNKVIIIGRLGKDPELKYTPTGMAVCEFTLATSEKFKDKQDIVQTRTEWHNIVAWGKLGELCAQYLSKGRKAFISGSLNTRKWDGQHGQVIYKTEIIAKEIEFLDGYPQNNQDKRDPKNQSEEGYANEGQFAPGEIPF